MTDDRGTGAPEQEMAHEVAPYQRIWGDTASKILAGLVLGIAAGLLTTYISVERHVSTPDIHQTPEEKRRLMRDELLIYRNGDAAWRVEIERRLARIEEKLDDAIRRR